MELLLIGMSRFARRRVLPAALAMSGVERVSIASAHLDPAIAARWEKPGRTFTRWRDALEAVPPGLAYVSLVNSEHAAAVRGALSRGFHVVVDKPALPDLATAQEAVSLARSASVVLAEATCYSLHPAFAAARSVFGDHLDAPTRALAMFTPPVPKDDFRYDPAKGGGALLDTGPYMASLGRVLWGTEPERLEVAVGERTADALESAYSVLATYPGGRSAVGHFGFTTVYSNYLQLAGQKCAVEIERPFSIPPDMTAELRIRSAEGSAVRTVDPADSMQIFLSRVLDAAGSGSREFDEPLLSDARTRERMTRAAAVDPG